MDAVYVVTGGGSGIGQAIASMLPRDADVIIADRSEVRLKIASGILDSAGIRCHTFCFDVSEREEVRKLAAFASSLGKVEKVFHSAGVSGSMADKDSIIRINALGTAYVYQEFYKVMDGGVICSIASDAGYVLPRILLPSHRVYMSVLRNEERFLRMMSRRCWLIMSDKWNRQVAYLISKNFARWYSQQCSFSYMEKKKIRVFTISPGFVKTPMTEAEKGFLSSNILTFTALNRGAEPEEMASIAISLSDDRCSYLIGTDILADGGCIDNGYRMSTCFRRFSKRHKDLNW